MKRQSYECGNCGNSQARWHIYLTDDIGSRCEKCYQEYMMKGTHIINFYLNRSKGWSKRDRPFKLKKENENV